MVPFLILLLAGWSCSPSPSTQPAEKEVYLFSFFQKNGEDGLHLASSEDGLTWTALRNNASFMTPAVGNEKLVRDPCIVQGPDGLFHMVWTCGWNENGIGYAHSPDLVNWSEQQFLPLMAHEPEVRNCWAPELYYDAAQQLYMIYWASTIPGRFPTTDSSSESKYNHRMYYTTTRDFKDFTPAAVLYDHGFSVIDATIQHINGQYVMFLKDETRFPEPEKNIRIATSDQLTGPYTPPSEPITGDWVEGPTALHTPAGWILYFDKYRDHHMGAIRSGDLQQWEDITEQLHFPEDTRHGTVFTVKASQVPLP